MSDTKDPFKDSFTGDDIKADDAFSQPDPFAGGFDSNLDEDFFKELDKLGTDTSDTDELAFLNQLDSGDDQQQDTFVQEDNPATVPPMDIPPPSDTASTDTPPMDTHASIPAADTAAVASPAVAATNKKPLFGKKTTHPADQKKLSTLIMAALAALVLLIGAWFLFNNTSEELPAAPVEMTEPQPTVTQTPTPEPIPAPTTPEPEIQAMPEIDTSMVDVGAIVTAEIPEDPALIKEEIDRLSDKEQRLAEQAQLIDEQLGMMAELTDAKQEQIALLEAQIAQLEAKKQP